MKVASLDIPVRSQLANHLAHMLGEMGEEAFVAAWRAALPDDDELLNDLLPQLPGILATLRRQQEEPE